MNKLEFKFPLPKDALCQVWLKLYSGSGGGDFVKFVSVFSQFCNPLLKRTGPSFEQT